MKNKEIQELLGFIAESGLAQVELELEGVKLKVRRYAEGSVAVSPAAPAPSAAPAPAAAAPTAAEKATADKAAATEKAAAEAESKSQIVRAPMIGTFYRQENPETPAFVEVGDTVSKGQTLCIIEAMKLFNEIESEVSGRVTKILVENATPVEYDQPLFLIEAN